MRVTVGAIRAIVRQEAGRLDEVTADTAGNQMIFGLMRGEVMESLQAMKSGPLRNRLVRLIAHLAKGGAAEQVDTTLLQKLERLSGLQAAPEEGRHQDQEEGEGSAHQNPSRRYSLACSKSGSVSPSSERILATRTVHSAT